MTKSEHLNIFEDMKYDTVNYHSSRQNTTVPTYVVLPAKIMKLELENM